MFQAQTDLSFSIFSIGIILTSKPKWDLWVKSKSWSYEDWGYLFRFCANVCRAGTMRRQRNRPYFKWIQSSLERKKHLFCRRLFTASKNTSHQEILCFSRAATSKKSDQKASAIMHVQSVHSDVLVVENHCFNFLTLLKLPNETNRTNISLLFTWLIKCSATGKVSNTACGFYYLFRPLIESALLKIMWLKVERSSL